MKNSLYGYQLERKGKGKFVWVSIFLGDFTTQKQKDELMKNVNLRNYVFTNIYVTASSTRLLK